MNRRIYLDHAATTPVDPRVIQAMLECMTVCHGNPSSIHFFGQEAKAAVEKARYQVAALIGAVSEELVFTSGGTESDNCVLKGAALSRKNKGNHIITTSIEHPAVLETCRFLETQGTKITYLKVDSNGLVDPADVRAAITPETILISVMHANNEVGTIEPIDEIGALAHENDVLFHTDAVQTLGHIPINVERMNIDFLSASAHKLYGPKGVGLLYIRDGLNLTPLLHGGEQERHHRASTLNVPAIVGFGEAASIAAAEMASESTRQVELRDRIIGGLLAAIDESVLNGHPSLRLPNNINMSMAHVEGESMHLALNMEGFAVSTGSACSAGDFEPSHVLTALGLTREMSYGALRLSLGRGTTGSDIDQILDILPKIVAKLRTISTIYKRHQA